MESKGRIAAILGAGVALGVAAWALVRHRNRKPILTPPGRVGLIGDSLAVGLTKPLTELAARDGFSLYSDARGGTRIAQWSSIIANAPIDNEGLQLVIVVLGTNDAAMEDPTSERDQLDRLVRRLAAATRVLWVEPPNAPLPHVNEVRAMIRASQAVAEARVIIMDSSTLQVPKASDGIHMTASGYKQWADLIWKFARSYRE